MTLLRFGWMLLASLLVQLALAGGSIEPVRTYNGVDRAFPVMIRAPRANRETLNIQLLDGRTAKVLDVVHVEPGKHDLAKLLPSLWKKKLRQVLYVQLTASGIATGPALVLQPLTNQTVATLSSDGRTVKFSPDEDDTYAGIRAWVDQEVVFETTLGNMAFKMRPDAAPNTTWNLLELVRGGFYLDIPFHRVVAKRKDGTPFVIQAGDPTGTGSGSPGYSFVLENSPLPHDFGVISMARSTDPNTNGSQFFVALSREGTKHLDGRYASFGELIEGADVVKQIAAVEVGPNDKPKNPPVIRRAILRPARPISR